MGVKCTIPVKFQDRKIRLQSRFVVVGSSPRDSGLGCSVCAGGPGHPGPAGEVGLLLEALPALWPGSRPDLRAV